MPHIQRNKIEENKMGNVISRCVCAILCIGWISSQRIGAQFVLFQFTIAVHVSYSMNDVSSTLHHISSKRRNKSQTTTKHKKLKAMPKSQWHKIEPPKTIYDQKRFNSNKHNKYSPHQKHQKKKGKSNKIPKKFIAVHANCFSLLISGAIAEIRKSRHTTWNDCLQCL